MANDKLDIGVLNYFGQTMHVTQTDVSFTVLFSSPQKRYQLEWNDQEADFEVQGDVMQFDFNGTDIYVYGGKRVNRGAWTGELSSMRTAREVLLLYLITAMICSYCLLGFDNHPRFPNLRSIPRKVQRLSIIESFSDC